MTNTKDHLEARHAELTDRLERLVRDAQRASGPLAADFAEQAAQRENDDVVDRLREVTTADLHAVSTALARLEKGSYGTCAKCGKRIDAARLAALPATVHCVDCKSAAANDGT